MKIIDSPHLEESQFKAVLNTRGGRLESYDLTRVRLESQFSGLETYLTSSLKRLDLTLDLLLVTLDLTRTCAYLLEMTCVKYIFFQL